MHKLSTSDGFLRDWVHHSHSTDIATLQSNLTPVRLRVGKGMSRMTSEYRALVAELVTHGVSCGKIDAVVSACANMFNVKFEGTL